ncbi:unnamed protein product [Amoebophrya sp. A25]|nr:unnamed protein product [Amoebophrya sp. A25]|eukprot:GSA25T00005341001.1
MSFSHFGQQKIASTDVELLFEFGGTLVVPLRLLDKFPIVRQLARDELKAASNSAARVVNRARRMLVETNGQEAECTPADSAAIEAKSASASGSTGRGVMNPAHQSRRDNYTSTTATVD